MIFIWQVLDKVKIALVYIQSRVIRVRLHYIAPLPFRIVNKVNAFFSNIDNYFKNLTRGKMNFSWQVLDKMKIALVYIQSKYMKA